MAGEWTTLVVEDPPKLDLDPQKELEQLRGQMALIRELVYGPPRKSAPDSWQALRKILEQTEPNPPQLVLNIRDAVTRSASPIEQAGRVRWLLQQEKLL